MSDVDWPADMGGDEGPIVWLVLEVGDCTGPDCLYGVFATKALAEQLVVDLKSRHPEMELDVLPEPIRSAMPE